MPKFRKRPVVVEAVQWDGTPTLADVERLAGEGLLRHNHQLVIPTREGVMTADPGDWIIKGVEGEIYPCKPDIFEATYEPAE